MNECVDCGQTAWVNSSDEFHNFTTTSTVYSSVEEVCLQSDLMMLWSSSLIAQNFVFRSNTHLNSNMDLVLLRRNRGGRWSGEKKGSFRGANVCGSVWLFWNSWRRLLSYLWISVCVCSRAASLFVRSRSRGNRQYNGQYMHGHAVTGSYLLSLFFLIHLHSRQDIAIASITTASATHRLRFFWHWQLRARSLFLRFQAIAIDESRFSLKLPTGRNITLKIVLRESVILIQSNGHGEERELDVHRRFMNNVNC